MKKNSLAIVVPCFNTEAYIEAALDSIHKQTNPPDEVIMVDDGSTDNTSEILAQYKNINGWRLYRTSNSGLGPSRNLGRALAQSEYVYFFDSDDILDRSFIDRMRELIAAHRSPDIIMFSGKAFSDGQERKSSSVPYTRVYTGHFDREDRLITELIRRRELKSSSCLYITKSEIWAKHRLQYPPILHEDEAVICPLLAVSTKTVIVDEIYFLRRIRSGSIMTSPLSEENAFGLLRVLNETMEFMGRKPLLVRPEIRAWHTRLEQLGSRYVALCKQTGTEIFWPSVFASIIEVGRWGYLARLGFFFLPKNFQNVVRTCTKFFSF